MAEKMKLGNNNPANTSSRNSSYVDCVCAILRLLTGFGEELNLGDDVLKIDLNTDAVDLVSTPAARCYNSLQLHISKLQAVSESLKTLVDAGDGSSTAQESTLAVGKEDTTVPQSHKEETTAQPAHHPPIACVDISEAGESKSQADDLIVQIRAGKSEIDRRIFAFMERKQMEINENNVREFCNVIDCNQENSCARTDAVFTPYPGFKSHVKVTRVVNNYGPQTRGGVGPGEAGEQLRGQAGRNYAKPAIEERLHNIETHLKLNTGPVSQTVYHRLKKLEDRILELEGLSPEYFQSTGFLHKRPRTSTSQSCSLTELDGKISAVKAALLKRANEFGPGYGTECLF